MRAAIVKIGNSRGIRIPKPFFEQCGFDSEVELEVQDHELVIRPMQHPRDGWDDAFSTMAVKGDDKLLDDIGSSWDDSEWEWK